MSRACMFVNILVAALLVGSTPQAAANAPAEVSAYSKCEAEFQKEVTARPATDCGGAPCATTGTVWAGPCSALACQGQAPPANGCPEANACCLDMTYKSCSTSPAGRRLQQGGGGGGGTCAEEFSCKTICVTGVLRFQPCSCSHARILLNCHRPRLVRCTTMLKRGWFEVPNTFAPRWHPAQNRPQRVATCCAACFQNWRCPCQSPPKMTDLAGALPRCTVAWPTVALPTLTTSGARQTTVEALNIEPC
jgi:hypothetical protein